MLELDEQLRTLIDAGATPVTAKELFEGLRSTQPRSERVFSRRESRRPRHSRGKLVTGAAFAVAAVVTVALVVIPGSTSLTAGRASAADFLKTAATIAQRQKPLVPGPGRFLYVATLVSMTNGAT